MSKRIGLVVLASVLVAGPAFAAAPSTSLIEGMLTSGGGGPAADGFYDVTFSLWEAKTGGTAVWTEGPVKVAVKGGQFHHALGSTKALDIQKLAALKAQWLGVKVGTDPMLPLQQVHATLFALHANSASTLTCSGCLTSSQLAGGSVSAAKVGFTYAGSDTKGGAAKDLKCTGCVSVAEMKFDGNADFGAFSIKAKNGTFSGGVAAGVVTANAFQGDGSKLTGIKIPKGECSKKGEVVKGINADGTLKCVAALDPSALPNDGLNEISNNMITNQFIYTMAAPTKKVRIPDNQGTEGVSNITFPNIGTAQTLEIKVAVENTDLSTLALVLLPPDDKKTGWVLCDPCGQKDSKKYSKTFTPKVVPQAQKGGGKKIDEFIGHNLQGLWTLKAKDTSFCIVQAPGNAAYCDTKNKKDGWITDWSIKMQYVSNQKIAVSGDQEVSGNIIANGYVHGKQGVQVGDTSVKCTSTIKGRLRWTAGRGLEACDGVDWVAALTKPVIFQGGCTSNGPGGNNLYYRCINHVSINTAQGYLHTDSNTKSYSTSDKYGRVWVDKTGYYQVNITNYGHTARMYINLNVNSKTVRHINSYHYTNWPRTQHLSSAVWLKKGDYVNIGIGTYSTSNHWHGSTYSDGRKTYARHNWVKFQYLGSDQY